jgi:DNA polymerase-3 subunit delta
MLIKYQGLPGLLQKSTRALYVLLGNDPYLLNDAAVQIKQSFLKRPDVSQAVIDIQSPADWSLLVAEANSYSLFSEYVFLDARYDKKTIDATGKGLLTEYLAAINDRCLILLRAPMLSAKAIQWLVDSPHTVVVQVYPFAADALKQWVDKQLRSKSLRSELGVTNLIHQYTQGNMLATAQLIEKLSLCSKPDEMITIAMIREQLSDQSHFEVYALAEACLNANAGQCLRLLQQFRAERIEPTLILWILTQEVRLLIQLHYLLKQHTSMDAACSQLKIWSSRIQFYAKATARLSLKPLLTLLGECKQLDEMIKTTQSMQIWDRFDLIALSLCSEV